MENLSEEKSLIVCEELKMGGLGEKMNSDLVIRPRVIPPPLLPAGISKTSISNGSLIRPPMIPPLLPAGSKTSSSSNSKPQDAAKRVAKIARRRMQKDPLNCEFGTILLKIMAHKLAWPFNRSITRDVVDMGLDDYYEVIKKPMDFTMIRKRMVARHNRYKNVREIYADMRLVFDNAMTYNEKGSAVHIMAKALSANFENKWLQFLPKVVADEERKRKENEAKAHREMLLAQEVDNLSLAWETSK